MAGYTYVPRCCSCNRFMPAHRSKLERRYYGFPYYDADDVEVGVCEQCETRHMPKPG